MDANENKEPGHIKVSWRFFKYLGIGVLSLFVGWFFVEGCKTKVAACKQGIYEEALKENRSEIEVLIEKAVADTLAVKALRDVEKHDYQKSNVKGQTRRELVKQKFYEKTGIKANDKSIDMAIDAWKADSLERAIKLRKANRVGNQ